MSLPRTFPLFVTHVESKGSALKICGQKDNKAAQFVESNIESAKEDFEQGRIGIPTTRNDLVRGVVCCARYQDAKYYRARILNVDHRLNVCVYFLDYGNTESIPVSDIRLLDHASLQNLLNLDPLASEYFLGHARPLTGNWDDRVINFVKNELMNTVLQCTVLGDLKGKKFISVEFKHQDFSEFLIGLGYASHVPLETQFIQMQAEVDIRTVEFNAPPPLPYSMVPRPVSVGVGPQRSVYAMPPQPIPRSMMSLPATPRMIPPQVRGINQPFNNQAPAQQFKCDLIEENSEHAVFVCHVEKGPQSFTVQLKNVANTKLVQMMKRLNITDIQPKCAPIMPGVPCLGRFSGDRTLCRAVVVGVADDRCKLYYVDFGNSEELPWSEIYELPQEFLAIKLMAYRFTLANMKNFKLTEEVERLFNDFVKDKEFIIKVTPPEEIKTKQYCEMFYQGRNIKEILNELIQEQRKAFEYKKVNLPARGSTVRVFVSHVDSVTKIFVQLIDDQDTLTSLMTDIANHCNNPSVATLNFNQLKPGLPVCAFYSDQQWYRAQIIDFNEVDAKVLFVDYGNEDMVPITSLRQISPFLVKSVESQAIECCLVGYEASEPNPALNNHLYEIIIEKSMAMKVFGILIGDVLIVEFFDDDNTKISSFLSPLLIPGYSHQPEAQTQIVSPAVESASVNDWKDYEGETVKTEKSSAPRIPKGREARIGSGSFDGRGDYDTDKKGGKRFTQGEEDDGVDNHRGGKFNKPKDDFSRQKGGRHDRPWGEDSGGGSGGDNWRQKKDRDDFSSGGNWRNKNGEEEEGWRGKKSSRNEGERNWRERDSDQNDKWGGGGGGGGGGFPSKSSRKPWDDNKMDSNDNVDQPWKSKDNRGSKFDRDNKFGNSSRSDNFKSQSSDKFGGGSRYNDGDSRVKGGKRDFGDRDSKWDGGRSSHSQPPAPKKLNVPKPSLKIGDRELIEIVYSLSPNEFYIQSTKSNSELTDLMAKIAEKYVSGGTVLSSVSEGDYCIAQYKEDEVWYRAIVKSSLSGTINVQFIDYGNAEEVASDQIKEISSDMCTLPAQAVKCCLLGASPASGAEWSDEQLTEFSLSTEGKTLEAHILSKNFGSGSFEIVLRDSTNPEEEVIINRGFGATDEVLNSITPPAPGDPIKFTPFPVQLSSTLEVQVTWLMSPHHFYVQPLFCNTEYRLMMEDVQQNVKSFQLVSQSDQSVDKSVLTYFKEDKAVYRAIIKESGKVQFVDYGNTEPIDKSHTWSVEPEYSLMPCQAIECSLAGVKPFEAEAWPTPKTTKIESFFESDSYSCTFQSMLEDGKFLVKLDLNGESVADKLVAEQLASVDETTIVQTEVPAPCGILLSLLPGQLVRTKVMSVKDVGTFICQLLPEKALAIYEEIAATVVNSNLVKLEKEKVVPGTFCLINTEDHGFQRACVWEKRDETNLVVELLDQGYQGLSIDIDEVFELPESIAAVPGFAFECIFKLKNDMGIDDMKETLENKSVILYIKSCELPNRLTVIVYDTNGNLLSEAVDGNEENVNRICPLPIFHKHQEMMISHAEKGAIYLQRVEDLDKITNLISTLFNMYSEAEINSDKVWETGMMCAAKSLADDQWYRAQIINIEGESMNVLYIDYGNSEVISDGLASRIAVLDESFLVENMYAVKVTLPVQWSKEEGILLDHFPHETFNTHFLRWKGDWCVNMINREGVSLIQKIAELEYGTALEDSPFNETVSGISKFNEGGSFKVCRMHVVSPSQFWVVLNHDFEKVECLQDKLQNLAGSMRPITRNSLQSQTGIIAAKFPDNIWYRALYKSATDTVFSVDYGHTEPCTGDLKVLPEELLEHNGFAVECSLKIQPVATPDWDPETKSQFDSLIPDDEVIINVLKNNGSSILVDLIVKDDSISESMISKGLALECAVPVYVSHINSPSDFYIQEENNNLDEIADALTKADEFTVIEDIESNKESVFAAKFSSDDLWYRAKYLDGIDGGAKVLFIDYGNTDEAKEFRVLPEELAALPLAAKHCSLCLKDPISDWSEILNAKDRFSEISGQGSTLFEMRKVGEGDPCIVNLTVEGQSVSDMLLSVAVQDPQEDDEEELKLRTKAIVSHINSPSDFWVQFENSPLETVASQLTNAEKWNVITEYEENSLVAALFEDSVWYRAQILSKADGVATVIFIDYGNVAPALEVRELPGDLKEIAPLAEHCRLKLPLGVLEWSEESIKEFSEMLGYGSEPVFINFLTSDDVPKTVELTLNDEDVGKHIAKFCESKETVKCSDKGQNVVVCHINSPKDFYVHSDLEAVDEMATKLLGGSTFEPCDVENLVGSLVVACFKEDEQWYRAKVISKSENSGFEVKFIDYGNTAIAEDFIALSSDLTNIPPLATWCCLDSHKNWSPEATDKFRDLAMDGGQEFEMIIVNENATPVSVDLILNGKHLHKILPATDSDEKTADKSIDHETPTENYETLKVESINEVSIEEENITQVDSTYPTEKEIELPQELSTEENNLESKFSNNEENIEEAHETPTENETSNSVDHDLPAKDSQQSDTTETEVNSSIVLKVDSINEVSIKEENVTKVDSTYPTGKEIELPQELSTEGNNLESKFSNNEENIEKALETPTENYETSNAIDHDLPAKDFQQSDITGTEVNSSIELKVESINEVSTKEENLTKVDSTYPTEKEMESAQELPKEGNNLEVESKFSTNEEMESTKELSSKEENITEEEYIELSSNEEKMEVKSESKFSTNKEKKEEMESTKELSTKEENIAEEEYIELSSNEEKMEVKSDSNNVKHSSQVDDLHQSDRVIPVKSGFREILDVTVCYVKNPTDFYVCTQPDKVEEMSSFMQEASKFELCEPSDEDINSLLAACFVEDDTWYRVKILSKAKQSGFEVLFIDYGNTDTAHDFRKLPDNLMKIPPLASHCKLDITSSLIVEITEKFKNLSDFGVQKFRMRYIDEQSSPCLVELFLDNSAVSEYLKSHCQEVLKELSDISKVPSEDSEKMNGGLASVKTENVPEKAFNPDEDSQEAMNYVEEKIASEKDNDGRRESENGDKTDVSSHGNAEKNQTDEIAVINNKKV